MSEFERLREQAARLLALALKARERRDDEQADLLAAQAAQYLDKATALNPPSANPQRSEHVAQQQQQPADLKK
jgi:HEPN domain-containing protein